MIHLSGDLVVMDREIEISAIRAQGPGGQNVNKVANAVQLRFDLRASALPEWLKEALMTLHDRRIGKEGVIVMKAQRFRSLERNREDALERLRLLLERGLERRPVRIATRPGKAVRRRRLDDKSRRGQIKSARKSPGRDELQ